MITWQKHWRFAHWHSRKGYENAWGWPEELFLKHHKISWKNKQKSLSALTALCLHQGRHQILWLHTLSPFHSSVQSLSHVVQLCDLMDCSTPGLPVHHQLPEFTQTHVHWVSDAIQPSHPLSSPLLPPSIFPSSRVFSNESALHIRWPKYWSFSFNISPSNEHPGLISFRMDWLDLFAVQGTLKSVV